MLLPYRGQIFVVHEPVVMVGHLVGAMLRRNFMEAGQIADNFPFISYLPLMSLDSAPTRRTLIALGHAATLTAEYRIRPHLATAVAASQHHLAGERAPQSEAALLLQGGSSVASNSVRSP
jgi:hypothetical protein